MKHHNFISICALFFVLSASSASWTQWQSPTEEINTENLSLELDMAKTMCLSQNERLYNDLVHIIDFTDQHLSYWQEIQHNPNAYFFSKGPFKWLWGKKQEQEIHDHITILQRCQSWAAFHLGHVAHLSDQLKKASTDEKIKPLIFQAISFVKNYLNTNKKQLTLEQTITIEELTALLQKNIRHLQDAKKSMMHMLQQHKKPGHVTRNWLYYTTATVLAAMAGNYLYHNPELNYAGGRFSSDLTLRY